LQGLLAGSGHTLQAQPSGGPAANENLCQRPAVHLVAWGAMMANEPFEVGDPSGLTDADWAYINKLGRALEDGGQKGLSKALDELASDPISYMKVIGTLFPDMVREAIRDEMAEAGMTEEDLREMVRKLESPALDQ
jgi:hypothetical protein